MSKNSLAAGNVARVATSRMASLASGIATGFLIPKILGVEDYGFFKIYTLYIVYTALLHFGFIDGILLKFAGEKYDGLDRPRFRTYTRFFTVFQLLVGMALSLTSLFIGNPEYRFIVLMLGINMVLVNLTAYYQFISQATERFKEYSARNFILSILKLLLVIGLVIAHFAFEREISYRLYVITLNAIDFSLLIWYVITYRDITFGKALAFSKLKKEIFGLFKIGITLTVAYQISHFVLALDRQLVSMIFPTETYAQYSFAYNIVTLISTLTSSLSLVLFPMLKRVTAEKAPQYYRRLLEPVVLILAASLMCYYPFCLFVEWFLPEYAESLVYLKVVLPILTFSSSISVVMFTFCKVLNRNMGFFFNGCITLAITLLLSGGAYFVWRSPLAISAGTLLAIVIWFVIEAQHLKRIMGVGAWPELLYLVLLALGFIANTFLVENLYLSFSIHAVFFLTLTFVFYRKKLGALLALVRNRK